MLSNLTAPAKNVLDLSAVVAAFGTVAQTLPYISAFLSIVWLGIRIFDYFDNKRKDQKQKLED